MWSIQQKRCGGWVLSSIGLCLKKCLFICNFSGLIQQFQLKPGNPDILYRLRTLLIVTVPIGVGFITGHPTASAIPMLTAMFVGMRDIDGSYRQKATAMIVATMGMTAHRSVAVFLQFAQYH